MPQFLITGPDGSQYRVSGDNEQGALQALQAHLGTDPATNQPPGVPAYSPPGVQGYDPETGEVTPQYGRAGSAAMGAADTATLGFGDEVASYLGSLLTGEPRDQVLSEMRQDANAAQKQNPGSYLAGQAAGALAGGAGLAKSGLSLSANAIRSGAGLGRTALASGIEGAALGAAHGFGSGEGVDNRIANAGLGIGVGGILGAGAPLAIAGASAAGNAIAAPLLARLHPEDYAAQAFAAGIKRSGIAPDDIPAILSRATNDGQDMFNVADALGHSGQRMLSTIARNPNDMRQTVADTLTDRQMGQGERLSNFLAEGFGAPDTAAQRAATLRGQRGAQAATNYDAARSAAGPVNLTDTIGKIDALLGRDPIMGDTALSAGPLGQRLMALRNQLQSGGEQLVDFNRVLNIKGDLYNAMKDNPRVANEMRPVYNALDQALENASDAYRNANDSYRAASQVMDAVDRGTGAASGRTRASDNIAMFNSLTPDEQNAFRAGYVDPLIARTENAAVSPSTNKARGLMTTKTGQEFPVFAAPGQADQLGNRIAREQRMFETANAALGGSKTADNLADAAEMSKFDPGVMVNLFRGRPLQAAIDSVVKLANEAKGMPPSVMDQLAKTLLETNPDAARAMIGKASGQAARADGRRALANAILINMGSSAAGRLAAP